MSQADGPDSDSMPIPTKRVFVGFPVSMDGKQDFLEVLKRLKIQGQKRNMEFQWSPPENYHVTLKFLGAVPSTMVQEISQNLLEVVRGYSPIPLKLSSVGSFPDLQHCRVLWVGVQAKRELMSLQGEVEAAMAALGFAPEDRDYRPHLTIARLRKSRNVADLISPYVRKSFGVVEVRGLTIYESLMHGKQVVYQALQHIPLGGVRDELP